MADYTPAVKKAVRDDAGAYRLRQGKGDHEIWYSPVTKRHFVIDGRIKSRHLANAVLVQAGLPKRF